MLGGIFFDLGAGSSNAVASDSSVLVCHSFETPADTPKGSFILPLKAANVLKGILPTEQPVKAVYDHRSARVAFGQIELTTRLVEGKYPKYRSVIPTDNANVLTVRREDLLRVLKRMAVLADRKTPGAKIVLSYNSMVLSAEDIGMAVRGHEEMKVDYDGDNLKVGMKIPKFMEALSNTESETVELRFKDERRAVLLQPSGEGAKDEGYLVILMPCMTK
jgi:DNA polymerase-3 subunit beta